MNYMVLLYWPFFFLFCVFCFYSLAEEKKAEGNVHYRNQDYRKALACYSRAIELCPDSTAYYGNRAACRIMMGLYHDALQDARDSVRLDKNFAKGKPSTTNRDIWSSLFRLFLLKKKSIFVKIRVFRSKHFFFVKICPDSKLFSFRSKFVIILVLSSRNSDFFLVKMSQIDSILSQNGSVLVASNCPSYY